VSEEKKTISAEMEDKSPGIPVEEKIPEFPDIKRQVFDVLYDDSKHEVWIGVRLRQTIKAQKVDQKTGQRGPVEDIEVNIDPLGAMISLDSAKQELLMALNRDAQILNEERARQEALKSNGIMRRLNSGLGKVFAGILH
jgi:hypothetical protein